MESTSLITETLFTTAQCSKISFKAKYTLKLYIRVIADPSNYLLSLVLRHRKAIKNKNEKIYNPVALERAFIKRRGREQIEKEE